MSLLKNIEKRYDRTIVVLFLLLAGLVVIVPLSIIVGPANIHFSEIKDVMQGVASSTDMLIVREIRIPRMLLAFLVGMALAVSGVVFQGLLTNPLAGPYTLGISSGAAFGASLAILFGFSAWCLPFTALCGAGLTLSLVLFLSRKGGGLEPKSLILAGIVVGSILSAAISLIKSVSGESLSSIVFWIMGSLSGKGWDEIKIFIPYLITGLIGIFIYSRDLDLLSMGSDNAHASGIDVVSTRSLLIFFASMITAAAVAVSGVIGFIGLIVPHAMRMIVGPAHRRLTLISALAGGVLLLYADTLARAISFAGEIPVGVITALLGGPFFCLLLGRRRI